jgi:hypothetical protein
LVEGQKVLWTGFNSGDFPFRVGPSLLIIYNKVTGMWGRFGLVGVFPTQAIPKGTILPYAQGTVISREEATNLIINGLGAHLSYISSKVVLNGGPGAGPFDVDLIANLNSSRDAYWAPLNEVIPVEGVTGVRPSWVPAKANVSFPQTASAAHTTHGKTTMDILVNSSTSQRELLADYDVRLGYILGPSHKVEVMRATDLQGVENIIPPVLGAANLAAGENALKLISQAGEDMTNDASTGAGEMVVTSAQSRVADPEDGSSGQEGSSDEEEDSSEIA